MKRLASLLLSVLLLCALSVPVFAAEEELTTYEIPDLGITLKLPAHYDVFTRDMAKDDPLFAAYETTFDDLRYIMTRQDCYLLAYPRAGDSSCQLTLTAAHNADKEDFLMLDRAQLEAYAAEKTALLESAYSSVRDAGIYPHPQTPFFRSGYSLESSGLEFLHYTTVYKGRQIGLRLQADAITADEQQAVSQVVDSMELGKFFLTRSTLYIIFLVILSIVLIVPLGYLHLLLKRISWSGLLWLILSRLKKDKP